jgi:hypothetical protein
LLWLMMTIVRKWSSMSLVSLALVLGSMFLNMEVEWARKTVLIYQMLKPCHVRMKVACTALHQAFVLNSSQGPSQNKAMHNMIMDNSPSQWEPDVCTHSGWRSASNIHKWLSSWKLPGLMRKYHWIVASHFGLEERIVSLRNMEIEKTSCWKHPGTHRTGGCVTWDIVCFQVSKTSQFSPTTHNWAVNLPAKQLHLSECLSSWSSKTYLFTFLYNHLWLESTYFFAGLLEGIRKGGELQVDEKTQTHN